MRAKPPPDSCLLISLGSAEPSHQSKKSTLVVTFPRQVARLGAGGVPVMSEDTVATILCSTMLCGEVQRNAHRTIVLPLFGIGWRGHA